jgi:hypothetical protein
VESLSIFQRKREAASTDSDIYSFAGVSRDNYTAKSIQQNVDLLRYLANHTNLDSKSLANYVEMAERYGMSAHPHKAELLKASSDMGTDQATQLRYTLAVVHIEALSELISSLSSAPPTMETVKMIEFAVDETQSTKKDILDAGASHVSGRDRKQERMKLFKRK